VLVLEWLAPTGASRRQLRDSTAGLTRLLSVSIPRRPIARTLLALALPGLLVYGQVIPRPERFGLATVVDGPAPADAAAVVVFLHGLGQGLRHGEVVAKRLREAGLAPAVSIVIVRAPYRFGLWGFSWGDTPEERARSRARLRTLLAHLQPQGGIVLAGFSQGATLALDTAAEEPRIGAVASFSPCYSEKRGELPGRSLRFLLAHGARDMRCPVEESRSLAKVLAAANKPVRFIEFDGPHEMPPEVMDALVALVAR
jgi:predicted esterase